jgi:hypothetical protein
VVFSHLPVVARYQTFIVIQFHNSISKKTFLIEHVGNRCGKERWRLFARGLHFQVEGGELSLYSIQMPNLNCVRFGICQLL